MSWHQCPFYYVCHITAKIGHGLCSAYFHAMYGVCLSRCVALLAGLSKRAFVRCRVKSSKITPLCAPESAYALCLPTGVSQHNHRRLLISIAGIWMPCVGSLHDAGVGCAQRAGPNSLLGYTEYVVCHTNHVDSIATEDVSLLGRLYSAITARLSITSCLDSSVSHVVANAIGCRLRHGGNALRR